MRVLNRMLFLFAFFAYSSSIFGQFSIGGRDNRYVYGKYKWDKGWSVKLEQSIYAETIGWQYMRLYTGYEFFYKCIDVLLSPYYGFVYNRNYYSTGGHFLLTVHPLKQVHITGILNPHYDSGIGYGTYYGICAQVDVTSQVALCAKYSDIPSYRMKDKRVNAGCVFKVKNLMAFPQISLPAEGKLNNIRMIVDFSYVFGG